MTERKRRADAVEYTFNFYGCKDVIMTVNKKVYVYEPVLMNMAKRISGYTQPVYSLYRDLHKSKSGIDIHGVRAICVDDFNEEGFLCKIKVSTAEGTNALFMEDDIK